MNKAESRKKEVTQVTFTTKKTKTLPNDATASSLEAESASALKVDHSLALGLHYKMFSKSWPRKKSHNG